MTASTPASGQVFVSSTCYDLVDVRAELAAALRAVGLTPIMSDQPGSGFSNPGDQNSIETCLVNLRRCDVCIVVLSQRYGPSLQTAGFEDVSATHLEYIEARKADIPVLVYVRDALNGEYEAWRKNKTLKTNWAKPDDAAKLFAFLDAHRNLTNAQVSNWFWPFRSSVDLCERVVADLGRVASDATVQMLSGQGRLPELVIQSDGTRVTTSLWNCGEVPAFDVLVIDAQGEVAASFDVIESRASRPVRVPYNGSWLSLSGTHLPAMRVVYRTPSGQSICDVFAFTFYGTKDLRPVLAGRYYVGSAHSLSSPELLKVGGYWMIPRALINDAYDRSVKFKPK